MVGSEKALGAIEVIKDRIQYRSQSLLNLACGYFTRIKIKFDCICLSEVWSINLKSYQSTLTLKGLRYFFVTLRTREGGGVILTPY